MLNNANRQEIIDPIIESLTTNDRMVIVLTKRKQAAARKNTWRHSA